MRRVWFRAWGVRQVVGLQGLGLVVTEFRSQASPVGLGFTG